MTTVVNLSTGEEVDYSIPPPLAVVAAYEYFTRKNKSTWDYLKQDEQMSIRCFTMVNRRLLT